MNEEILKNFFKVYLKYFFYSIIMTAFYIFIYSFICENSEKLNKVSICIFYFSSFILYRVIKNEKRFKK